MIREHDEEDFGPDTPPAGFIPPECREFIYQDLDPGSQLMQDLINTTGVYENGVFRRYTPEEISQRYRKIIGVRDTRNGTVHGQYSSTPFVSMEFNHDS